MMKRRCRPVTGLRAFNICSRRRRCIKILQGHVTYWLPALSLEASVVSRWFCSCKHDGLRRSMNPIVELMHEGCAS